MNEITLSQLENLIRVNAPKPPPGREEAVNCFIARAMKEGTLVDLALITLMSQGVSPKKSFKMLTKAGVAEEEISEALGWIKARLAGAALVIKCTIEEVPQHGPN